MAFRVAAAQGKKICPERLNLPGRYSGVDSGGAEGARAPPEFGVQKRGLKER